MTTIDSEALVETYQENGYVVIERFFEPDEVTKVNAAIDEVLATDDLGSVAEVEPQDASTARRIWSPTKRHPAFEAMSAHPRLLDAIEQLIGPDILFHHSKLHLKAPRVGSVVEWHQERLYPGGAGLARAWSGGPLLGSEPLRQDPSRVPSCLSSRRCVPDLLRPARGPQRARCDTAARPSIQGRTSDGRDLASAAGGATVFILGVSGSSWSDHLAARTAARSPTPDRTRLPRGTNGR
jgi:hypothetical protein